jgi:ribosomal protein L40E
MDSQAAPHTSDDAPTQVASAASNTESVLLADPSTTRTQTVISNSIFNPSAASDAALRLKIAYLLQKFVSCSIASLGVILVLLALSIMCYLFYSWFNHILPLIGGYTMWNTAQTAFGLFLLYGVFFNYMMTLRTGPGHVPADIDQHANTSAQTSTGEQSTLLPLGMSKHNQMGFCTKCDRPKPPRAHHCHLCNTCVLKMDHHCPWIANCGTSNSVN